MTRLEELYCKAERTGDTNIMRAAKLLDECAQILLDSGQLELSSPRGLDDFCNDDRSFD